MNASMTHEVCGICGTEVADLEHEAACSVRSRDWAQVQAAVLDRYRLRPDEPRLDLPFDAALACANALLDRTVAVDPAGVVEGAAWWYLPITWIGCVGLLVDKVTRRASVLGSAIALDDWLWAANQGYREPSDLVLDAVLDRAWTLALVDRLQPDGLVELPPRKKLAPTERTEAVLAQRRSQRDAIAQLRKQQLARILDAKPPILIESSRVAWILRGLRALGPGAPIRYRFLPRRIDGRGESPDGRSGGQGGGEEGDGRGGGA
jgi:hypothetical protein